MNRRLHLLMLTLAAVASMANGPIREPQPILQRGYEPVEALVDDVDPTATSLRRLETGLAIDGGQETYIYRRRDRKDDDRLYYVVPGVVAEFDRSEYIQVEHRRQQYIFRAIPANTIFHLGLPKIDETGPRINPPHRLRTRIGSFQLADDTEDAEQSPAVSATAAADAYARHRRAQRTAVLRAIDRLANLGGSSP